MPIYDISCSEKKEKEASFMNEPITDSREEVIESKMDRFFSSLMARIFFLILLIGDLFWMVYAITVFSLTSFFSFLTFFRVSFTRKVLASTYKSLKRSIVCGISLFFALFSPAFGLLVACTYFLMYDPKGIEEVVPSSLRSQFKDFFKSSS